jgi:hypothetical protein
MCVHICFVKEKKIKEKKIKEYRSKIRTKRAVMRAQYIYQAGIHK